MSNHYLTIQLTKQRLQWLHMIKNKSCRISPGKSVNKQQRQTATITNSEHRERGNLNTWIFTSNNLKYPIFDKNLWYTEIAKYSPCIGGGGWGGGVKWSMNIIPEEAYMLELLCKDFRSTNTNILKEVKETMSTE